MKTLLKRNLMLRKYTLIVYVLMVLAAPIVLPLFHGTSALNFILKNIFTTLIMFIMMFDSGQVFRLQFKLGGNRAYYFNHSLPFSARQQLNAHYLTTLLLTLAGALVLIVFNDVPQGAEINSIELMTPLTFVAINLFGHAIAFPKSSEVRRDFIPYWGYIVVANIVTPILIVTSFFFVAFLTRQIDRLSDKVIEVFINHFVFWTSLLCIAIFIGTYFYQLRKIKLNQQSL
ncbi:phenol-soluble modulin export ABC transporter permease subunit PmtB [Staphylococcus simulans]|uniref:phenol-soluble modulin export ABC transporter permease subunit PmtB n=1 Tax=Staphylococcus simulans TaxID=1286 RepID=UPI003999EE88